MDLVAFVSKWLHLLSMIGMLGGTTFAWFVLHPALKDKGDDPEAAAIWRKYGMMQAALWVLVLLTGFYNYYVVSSGVTGPYHMFLGMKIMLAILMFLLAMLAAHPAPGLEKITRNKGPLLAIILVMGVVAVGLSAHLNMGRMSGKYKKVEAPAAAPMDVTSAR
jgi:uncharacterized membrane protein